MDINMVKDGSALCVALTGRLDTSTSPKLEDKLKESLVGVTELIFDLKELEYISSAGLRVLLGAHKTMLRQGSMKVKNLNEIVSEVFEVTGFSDILTVE